MTKPVGPANVTAQTSKEASGVLVYLIEELGDARLRASQLKQYVAAAQELVEKSEKKDHIHEVAADILHGLPDTLFKLDKALDAAAMAASRMDYEEIKQGLKPEKAEELERVLEDVRLQYLNRRSEPMNAKKAAELLDVFATATDATGTVPTTELSGLIAQLERGQKQASKKDPAVFFREAAEYLRSTPNPSRRELAATLRRVLADNLDLEAAGKKSPREEKALADLITFGPTGFQLSPMSPKEAEEVLREKYNYSDSDIKRLKTAADDFDMEAGAGEQFKKVNPDISDEAVERINEQHEKNKDVVKEKHAAGTDPKVELFDKAYISAKLAHSAAAQGNARKAASYGVTAIEQMTRALGSITPSHADFLSAVGEKVDGKRAAIVSDAVKADVLAVPEPTEDADLDDFNAPWSRHHYAAEGIDADYGLGLTARYEKGKPADPTENMTDEDAAEWAAMNEQHADKFKTASDEIEIEYKVQGKDWTPKKFRNGREFEAWYDKMHKKPGFEINEESVEGHSEEYLRSLMASENYGLTADDDKAARFEQGKPADPTENMTDEDAAEWQANTEQYGDKFKTAVTYSR